MSRLQRHEAIYELRTRLPLDLQQNLDTYLIRQTAPWLEATTASPPMLSHDDFITLVGRLDIGSAVVLDNYLLLAVGGALHSGSDPHESKGSPPQAVSTHGEDERRESTQAGGENGFCHCQALR